MGGFVITFMKSIDDEFNSTSWCAGKWQIKVKARLPAGLCDPKKIGIDSQLWKIASDRFFVFFESSGKSIPSPIMMRPLPVTLCQTATADETS